MLGLKSYGYITAHDLSVVTETGKLNIADDIACPFSDGSITVCQTDARGVRMPFCFSCGVFLVPVWEILEGPKGNL